MIEPLRSTVAVTGSIGEGPQTVREFSDEASLRAVRIRWPTSAYTFFARELTSTNPRYARDKKRQITLVSLSRYHRYRAGVHGLFAGRVVPEVGD